MFFEGTLQEGISTALQQSKQVVCFVTDGASESQQWEDEFLTDDSIRPGLESQSVILRLLAGSEEAGYLEALFPVPKKPTIVIIQNGQLKEYIASGTSRDEFIKRLSKTISSGAQSQPSSSSLSTPVANPAQSRSAVSQPSHSSDALHDDIQPTVASTSSSVPVQGAQSITTEEEKRAAAEKKGKARAEAEEEARRRVDERCGCEPPNPEQAHANEIKQRKQHANEERKRILKRIEDDKRARKERDAAERRARSLLNTNTDSESGGGGGGEPSIPLRQRLPKAGQGEHCNLQVRLLDGSTIRMRFASDQTLGRDVREWIDAERTDGDAPYAFRIMLTPQPNKAIKAQEESKTLLSLGLAPSATLVLIPTRYSVAYAGAGGLFSPVIGAFSTLYGAIMASLGGLFSLLFGGGGPGESPGGNDIPMENLRARRRDAQLYNGNSLNFEPRNEDEEENNTR